MNGSIKRQMAARAISPVDREISDSMLERMERYTNHLEGLLLRKNDEIRSLQRTMAAMAVRVEDKRQKAIENECVISHQTRQAAMGWLPGVVAHQWRQPLNFIALVVQNMKEALEAGGFDSGFLARSISQAMEQICLLSRSIGDYSCLLKPANHTEQFDPKQCVEEILALLSGWYSNFSTYEMRISDETEGEIRIAGCRNAFQQVILNLLRNADEALQEQSRRIGRSFCGEIEICFRCRDDVIVSVAHNGGGMDESVVEHFCDPCFTTKSRSIGFGIGLYLSRIIIENNMNGSIWAENIPDGALIGVRLPTVHNYQQKP